MWISAKTNYESEYEQYVELNHSNSTIWERKCIFHFITSHLALISGPDLLMNPTSCVWACQELLDESEHDCGRSPCSWDLTWGSVEPHAPAAGWTGSSCCPVSPSPCRLSPPPPAQHQQSHMAHKQRKGGVGA